MRTEPSFSAKPEELSATDGVDHQEELDSSAVANEESSDVAQHLADYRQRYGLSVDPFADDQHFPFYTGGQRRQILDQLLHLCQFSRNLLVVLGGFSIGKTRMAQALIDSLDDADDICFLEGQVNSSFESLMSNVLAQYELPDIETFTEFVKRHSESDGLAVIIVDNAHHLADNVLLKLVSLMGADTRVHLVFFAEPHLLPRLQALDVGDLALSEFGLTKFSLAETVDYLNFRMEMADYLGPELFTESNVENWWRQSRGQLLELHEYAQTKLLAAVPSSRKVDYARKGLPVPHMIGAAVLGAGLIMGLVYWGSGSSSPKNGQALTTISVPQAAQQSLAASLSSAAQSSLAAIAQTQTAQTQTVQAETAQPSTSTDKLAAASTGVATSIAAPVAATRSVVTGSAQSGAASGVAAPGVATTAVTESSAAAPPLAEAKVVKQEVVPLVQAHSVAPAPASAPPAKASGVAAMKETKPVAASPEKVVAKKADIEPEKAKPIAATSALSDQENTLLSWDASDFTLQLVGLSSAKAVNDFIAQQPNRKDLLLFKSLRQGKDWFVVVTGRYPSAAKARQASQALPESQRKAVPWPRDLKTIQKEIRAR